MTRAVADERHILTAAGVPRLIYGTAWKNERTAELGQALRAGFRGIDTACQPEHYDEPPFYPEIDVDLRLSDKHLRHGSRGSASEALDLSSAGQITKGSDPYLPTAVL